MSDNSGQEKPQAKMPQPGEVIAKMQITASFDPNQPDGIGISVSYPKNLKMALIMLSKATHIMTIQKLPDDLREEEARLYKPTGGNVAQFGRG